jgi:uncharacterized protein (TIGR02594 family)
MYECPWLQRARKYIGVKEIHGHQHNPLILRMWERIKAKFRDDETPWCAAFVGSTLELSGIQSTRSAAARSYQTWGVKIDRPIPGAIVVFWRGSPNSYSGHVGFVTGVTRSGNLVVLGGNQGDEVSEKAFARDRVVSYRWPLGVPVPKEALKVTDKKVSISTSEA